jgi:imidazolonepropionase-like amidohydrolase
MKNVKGKMFLSASAANLRVSAVRVSIALALAAFVVASSVSAQQTRATSAGSSANVQIPQGVFAIRTARIVTVSGADIESGTLVIRNGRIEAIGANVAVPNGAQIIDGRGLSVYPGMIDLGTSLGLVEIASGAPGTVDLTEIGDMNPNVAAYVAVNPHSANIPVTRVNGITAALTMPQGGIISGQASFINLYGMTPAEMAIERTSALVIQFPRLSGGGGQFAFARVAGPANIAEATRTRDTQIDRIRRILRDAEAYGQAQDAFTKDSTLPRPNRDIVLASLVPYVRGERPVLMRADRESDIRGAIRFAEEMKLKPIILGGNEAHKAAQFLREKNVPVILTGVLDLPAREDDHYDVLYENAAKLQAAGVRFCISTGDTGANVRDLPYHAGMSASFGLPRAEALKAVTLYPAQIIGVADRVGSLEAGKIANVVVTDGDLLEARTRVRHLFIQGRQIPLTSRHTELFDQFKDRK